MSVNPEAWMTPTSILSVVEANIYQAQGHRDRAARNQDWNAVEYWCGRVDALKEVQKILSLYWAMNPVVAVVDESVDECQQR